MRITRTLLCLVATLWFGNCMAGWGAIHVVEDGFETSTEFAQLPVAVPGTMTARACGSCEAHVLKIDRSTVFLINEKSVSLAELRDACGSRTSGIFIAVDAKSKVVRRIHTGCTIKK